MNPSGQQPEFFGVKVSKPGINVNAANDTQLIYKDDYSTKTYFDNSGNVVMQEGKLSNGQYGLALNPNSTSASVQVLPTQISVYNAGVEQIRIGLLPDGTYGMVVTKAGTSITQAYSS